MDEIWVACVAWHTAMSTVMSKVTVTDRVTAMSTVTDMGTGGSAGVRTAMTPPTGWTTG